MKYQPDNTADHAFNPLKFGLIIFFAVLCLYFSFDLFLDPSAASRRYRFLTFPLFTVIISACLFHAFLFIFRKLDFIKLHRYTILFCVVVSIFLSSAIFMASPQKLRIFDDAPDRLTASIAFSEFRRCERLHSGIWEEDGHLTRISSSRTARSTFFPYLLSLINSAVGFHISNVFLLNWVVLNLILIIASLSVVFFWGRSAALCTQLLILSQPLVLYVTESACYEGIGAVALMILWCASFKAIADGPGYNSSSFMILASAAALHCRPEMIAIIALTFLITVIFTGLRVFKTASFISFLALFASLMPYIWHRISFKWSYPTMDIDASGALGVAAPTVSKFTDSLAIAFLKSLNISLHSFFDISDKSPFNGTLQYFFLIVLAFYSACLILKKIRIEKKFLQALLSPVSGVLAYIALITLIGWSANHPNTARYFIFFPIATSIAVVTMLYSLKIILSIEKIILPFCLSMLLCFLPNITSPRFYSGLSLMSVYYHETVDMLNSVATPRSLIISVKPEYLLINKWSSISFHDLKLNSDKVYDGLREGKFDNVFIVQQMDRRFRKLWDASDSVDKSIETEVISKRVAGQRLGIKISKIIL